MTDEQFALVSQELINTVRGAVSGTQTPKVWFNTEEAATYCGISKFYLGKLRERGTGPNYRKFGKSVIYHINDLDSFMLALPTKVCRKVKEV